MPKEYILRLVFDRNHRSLVALRRGGGRLPAVVGGISFRPFHAQNFAEIVFCAVRGDEQVRGFGARLMDHLKEHAKAERLFNFLTFADNHAIGYFKKQGFGKVNNSVNSKWSGFIKEYDGGTLMECKISPKVDYLRLRKVLRLQRRHLAGEIRRISSSHVVRRGARGLGPAVSPARLLELLPGLAEAGWAPEMLETGGAESDEMTGLYAKMGAVVKALKGLKDVWPFTKPVDGKQVEDYYKVIKTPMDISMITKRLNEKYYTAKEEFVNDFRLIFENCKNYNGKGSLYYKCACAVEKTFESLAPSLDL